MAYHAPILRSYHIPLNPIHGSTGHVVSSSWTTNARACLSSHNLWPQAVPVEAGSVREGQPGLKSKRMVRTG